MVYIQFIQYHSYDIPFLVVAHCTYISGAQAKHRTFYRRQGKITEVKKWLDFYYVCIKFYYIYFQTQRQKGVSYMACGWDHILANPVLFSPCVSHFFYPLGTNLSNSYIPGLYGTFCFHLKNHKSEIDPAEPQSCYCYDGIYEFIDLCHRQNYYRAIPVIVQSHLWPELPIFATDALLAICRVNKQIQWIYLHQHESMNS